MRVGEAPTRSRSGIRPPSTLAGRPFRTPPTSTAYRPPRASSSSCVPTSAIRPPCEDDDPVGRPGRLEPVGDDDRRPSAGDLLHGRGHAGLGRQVEVGRGFVEQQDRGVDELGAGQRDQLALTRRERPAPLGQLVQVPAGQLGDEVVRADGTGRRLHLRVGRLGPPVGDVVPDRARRTGTPPAARSRAGGGTTRRSSARRS